VDRSEAEAIYDAGRDVCVEFVLDLAARVEQHEDRLRRLEQQARQDSRTSSKPPSSDPPKTRQQRRAEARAKAKELLARRGAKRTAGGQEGRQGAGRRLESEDQVDEIVCHYPDACRGCGREFSEDEHRPAGRFGRHQIVELPPISVLVVEHRTRRLRCAQCRVKTTATLPAGVGGSAFGPRLRAAIVMLTARNRISRRGAGELAGELFATKLSTGSVDAICQHASDLLAGPYQQLHDWTWAQDALHVDQTGWRTAGDSRALWTMTAPGGSLFEIAEHCNREQLDELSGPYPGAIVSDRWPGYEHLDAERRQVCWSHLQRDFRRSLNGPRARASEPGCTGALPTTCSRSGPRCGPSSSTPPWSRPTTPPNARSAARSSTESSLTAPAPRTANDSPSAPSPLRRPAASSNARCSTSSPNC
jgi:transposase